MRPHVLLIFVLLLAMGTRAASADRPQTPVPQDRFLGYLPRPSLRSLSLGQLNQMLDVLADLLDEYPTADGGTRVVSRLAIPTLEASNELCRNHTQIYWQEITTGKFELWALKMFDATGKLPDGLLAGNVNAFGSWDECLNTEAKLNGSLYPYLPPEALEFRGRYTPVSVFRKGMDPYAPQEENSDDGLGEIIVGPTISGTTGVIGVCVPSSCSSEDVREGLQSHFGDNFTVYTYASKTKTDTATLTWSDIFVIVIMSIVGYLIAVGTFVDVSNRHCRAKQADELQMTSVTQSANKRLSSMMYISEPQPAVMQRRKPPVLVTGLQVLVAFSLYTNVEKLLDTRQREGSLSCLHGIRFFSMTWVVLGHVTMSVFSYDANPMVAFDWVKNVLFQAVANATPSVDTFFLLSGLLLCYGFCASYAKTKRFNPLIFYLHRVIRLTPALAIMVGISATWYIYLGDGPLWDRSIAPMKDNCIKYGWHELLYISNFFDVNHVCIGQAWYLAVDTQLFVLSPIVILPLVWKPKLGALWLSMLTVAFVIVRVIIWDVKELSPTILILHPGPHVDELNVNYSYPWNRCCVWLLGIGLGYLLHRLRGKKISLNPFLVTAGWLAAAAIGLSVIYGMYGYQMPWQPYSKAVAVTYGGLNRFAWGVAVSWVIFACVTGHGGWVNSFLSYKAFIPLSRLTYSCYLVHIIVIEFVDCSVKGVIYTDVFRLVYRILAHLITSLAFAVPLSLAFEVPFMNLEKLIFAPSRPKIDI